MKRTAALLVGTLAVVTVAAPTALAAPKKKPITKTYDVSAPMPDVTNNGEPVGLSDYSVCAQNVPGSFDKRDFQVPAAGKLSIELKGFQGDWDLLLEDSDGSELVYGGSSSLGGSEVADASFKKAQKVSIVACNFAGTPNASVTYTFTYK
jgi:hypothetical protein